MIFNINNSNKNMGPKRFVFFLIVPVFIVMRLIKNLFLIPSKIINKKKEKKMFKKPLFIPSIVLLLIMLFIGAVFFIVSNTRDEFSPYCVNRKFSKSESKKHKALLKNSSRASIKQNFNKFDKSNVLPSKSDESLRLSDSGSLSEGERSLMYKLKSKSGFQGGSAAGISRAGILGISGGVGTYGRGGKSIDSFDSVDSGLKPSEIIDYDSLYSSAFSNRKETKNDNKFIKQQKRAEEKQYFSPAFKPSKISNNYQITQVFQQILLKEPLSKNLTFKDPSGYWKNTYIPGDHKLHVLKSKLLKLKKHTLFFSSDLQLENNAHQYHQPFDNPKNAALAVYMSSSQKSVEKPERIIVQVGITGTSGHSRTRPPINLSVVLDLREKINITNVNLIKSLIKNLQNLKDINDNFSIVVAGKPGGLIVSAANFKSGPVIIALQNLFGTVDIENNYTNNNNNNQNQVNLNPKVLNLNQALKTAVKNVNSNCGENNPLGSSIVLLVTPNVLHNKLYTIETTAHQSAVNGIPISVVGTGKSINTEELDRIALAGQGNHYFLSNTNDSKRIIEQELTAVSRVIARAIRLRIRLAPNVKLINVLGSAPLNELQSNRVRKAEQSIDLRVSKDTGIQADRGEDEDGIQIVIPAFYAGDSHVILLDVVAEKPGHIADVQMRYKDLVHLKNGITWSSLNLDRYNNEFTKIQLNVFKNLLAAGLSQVLINASNSLQDQNIQIAHTILKDYYNLLSNYNKKIEGLNEEKDFLADLVMINEYISLLNPERTNNRYIYRYLAHSLHYAAYKKILTKPTVF